MRTSRPNPPPVAMAATAEEATAEATEMGKEASPPDPSPKGDGGTLNANH